MFMTRPIARRLNRNKNVGSVYLYRMNETSYLYGKTLDLYKKK